MLVTVIANLPEFEVYVRVEGRRRVHAYAEGVAQKRKSRRGHPCET